MKIKKNIFNINNLFQKKKANIETPLDMMKKIKKHRISFFTFIFIYYKRYLWKSLVALLTITISSFSVVTLTYLINALMNEIIFTFGNTLISKSSGIYWWIWLIIIIIDLLVAAVTINFRERIGGMLGRNIEIDIRNAVLNNLINLNIGFYSDKKIGEIMTKLVNDTQILGDESQLTPANLISIPIMFFGSIISLILIDWQLALICLETSIVFMFLIIITFKTQAIETEKVKNKITNINGDIMDRISSIALIKANGTEEYEKKRFENIHKEYYDINRKLTNIQARMTTIITLSSFVLTIIILISIIFFYQEQDKNKILKIIKIIPAFITGINTLTYPIWTLSGLIPGLSRATSATNRIMLLIKTESTINKNQFGININNIFKHIIFKDVVFAYPEKPEIIVLPKTNLVFKKGKSYAFVGETGSGKSTISKLLLRFYDPTKGKILINNVDLKTINLNSYLQNIGYVEQEPKILFGDFIYNVKYGKFDVTDEEVIEVCKKAKLHKLVMSWKDGYKTIIGEHGFILSGGQKQRLVIARMMIKNPEILILDEATSSLDNIIEQKIQKELEQIMIGKTTILIAHRLSTIENVDKIFVLAKGKGVVQQGTFKELITTIGPFSELYKIIKK